MQLNHATVLFLVSGLFFFCSAHAYQLHCLLSLLQPTSLQAGLLDDDATPASAAAAASSSASSAAASSSSTTTLPPVAPPHHRIRITMLQYLGMPVADPFVR